MSDEEKKQLILSVVQLGEDAYITPLTKKDVLHLLKKEYHMSKQESNDLLRELKYEGLLQVTKDYVAYVGYKDKYPICGE